MFDSKNIYTYFDLNQLQLLPSKWDEEIWHLTEMFSYPVSLDGKSSTSREPTNISPIDISVVDGDLIFSKLPWLYKLYSYQLLKLANAFWGNEYEISKNRKNSININYLKGKGSRYEWHVDSNPLTGLLFVTTHNKGDGGELIFRTEEDDIIVYPKRGLFILFDARKIPHTVSPIKNDTHRISIPMNYYIKNEMQKRPADLDNYIYGA